MPLLPSTPAARDKRAGLENFSSQTDRGRSRSVDGAPTGAGRWAERRGLVLLYFASSVSLSSLHWDFSKRTKICWGPPVYQAKHIWWWCAQAAVSRRPRPAHNYRRFTIVQLWLLPTSRWATLGLAGLFTSLVLILGHPVHFQNRTITSQNSGTMLIIFCHMLISLGLPQLILQHSVWRHYLITFCSQYLVPLSRGIVMGSVFVPFLTEKELKED